MKNLIIFFIISILGAYFFYNRDIQATAVEVEGVTAKTKTVVASSIENTNENIKVANIEIPTHQELAQKSARLQIIRNDHTKAATTAIEKTQDTKTNDFPVVDAVPFTVDDDGLATVDGDIVLGEVVNGGVNKGYAKTPEIILWPDGKIPFFIQGDVDNPERIIKAMAMFGGTPIQFVPYQGDGDVLVFNKANSGCKSYLGKIGGKQPIWISSECGATEIAHEIMHALGFIHEQNRTDRESYVRVMWENVEHSAKINFQLFPDSLMIASGRSAFDFQSIMLYHASAFSKNGQATLLPVDSANSIRPSSQLSAEDMLRLDNVYRY